RRGDAKVPHHSERDGPRSTSVEKCLTGITVAESPPFRAAHRTRGSHSAGAHPCPRRHPPRSHVPTPRQVGLTSARRREARPPRAPDDGGHAGLATRLGLPKPWVACDEPVSAHGKLGGEASTVARIGVGRLARAPIDLLEKFLGQRGEAEPGRAYFGGLAQPGAGTADG